MPLREIEAASCRDARRAISRPSSIRHGIYTLKFLRNGTVIWVDVDGRSGQSSAAPATECAGAPAEGEYPCAF
jgi:hypothetical protein